MPYKDPVKRKEYQKKYHQEHKEKWDKYEREKRDKERQKRNRAAWFQRWKEKRNELIQQFGGKCQICGYAKRVEFHHRIYAEDSASGTGRSSTVRSTKEAIKHPERFILLCHSCHRTIHIFSDNENAWRTLKELIEDARKNIVNSPYRPRERKKAARA